MSEPNKIEQTVEEVEYAATSVTGSATINVYNYYYSEDVRVTSVKSYKASAEEKLPCPYRGLFHFGPGDGKYFFGRESFVEKLFHATQTRNFIPVLGASGSGKSSVVLAGLVPKLQQTGHWKFTHFRPGSDPFHALSLALVPLYATNLNETERIAQARQLTKYLRQGDIPLADVWAQIQQNYPRVRVLLIADQFEELYTLCSDVATRHNFLDLLLPHDTENAEFRTANSELRQAVLVLTMRADLLGNALSYRPFADVLQNADIKLGAMNREELAEAIEKPAQKLGVAFEAGLVERILKDVEKEPGNLPLLEFALTELWQRRQGKQLTHVAYTEIGEVQGALARHADESYGKLNSAEQEQVRRIFIQLVRPGEGTEDTRRLATKAELGEASWALVKHLADARLVVTSCSEKAKVETVEVVHEALIRNWGKLRGWMATDRGFRAWQERLRVAMAQWQETDKDEGSLFRGAALAEAEEKLRERPDDLNQAEQDFIGQSLQEQERLEKEKAARRRREIRTAWGIAVVSLVAVVISTGLGVMAFRQWKRSERVTEGQINALSRYSLSLLNLNQEFDALLEALRAGQQLKRQEVKPETQLRVIGALQKAVYAVRERNRLVGHDGWITSVSFSPDAKLIATASFDQTVKLWSIEGEELQTLAGHAQPVLSVSFSPDGKLIATASEDKTVKLWSIEGEELQTLIGHNEAVQSASFSPDGQTIASASIDKTVKLWSLEGKELQSLKGHEEGVLSVSFSPNGQTIATASFDKTVKLWSIEGEKLQTLTGHNEQVKSVSFSPDGKMIATASDDETVKLWSIEGEQLQTLIGHNEAVQNVSFSPDGKMIATSGNDGRVKLWSIEGEEIQTFTGHDEPIYDVSFSSEGQMIATASEDTTVKLWTIQGEELQSLTGHAQPVYSVSFSPDGQMIATASGDTTVKLWSIQGEELQTLTGHDEAVQNVSFSPDNKIIATASEDTTVKLWSIQGEQLQTLTGHNEPVYSVSFSPDGEIIATTSYDKTVKLWSKKGEEIQTLTGHNSLIWDASFSPDAKTLATASDKVILWNLDLDALIRGACNWVGDYLKNKSTPDSERALCQGIKSN